MRIELEDSSIDARLERDPLADPVADPLVDNAPPPYPPLSFHDLDACWRAAPEERSPLFFPTYAAVSVSMQEALRSHIPSVCLADPNRFEDTKFAYAMLVYACSRPYRGKTRTEFTYEVLDPAMQALFFHRAKKDLLKTLPEIVERLRSGPRPELARRYEPRRAVDIVVSVQKLRKSRTVLYRLLSAESALVNDLLQLAGWGGLPERIRARRFATLAKRWDYQLRRICAGHDFRYFAPALLESAAAALRAAQAGPGLLDEPDAL